MKKPNVDPEICQEPRPGLPYIDSSNVFALFSHGVDKKQEPSENTEQYFASLLSKKNLKTVLVDIRFIRLMSTNY